MTYKSTTAHNCASILIYGLLAIAPASLVAATPPVIDKATFNFTSGNPNPVSLDIYGSNFGALTPTVTIAGVGQVVAAGHSATFIRINNPNLSLPLAGIYRGTIVNNSAGGPVDGRTGEFY